jgi:hypothetical protein
MIKYLILLVYFFAHPPVLADQQESLEILRAKILRIFDENRSEIARQVRLIKPEFVEASEEMIFSRGNCQPASEALQTYLLKAGLKTQLRYTRIHVYITTEALVDGVLEQVIIDPTYRQFFLPNFDPLWGRGFREGALIQEDYLYWYKLLEMPFVAVVPTKEMKDYLESFPLPPGWITANKVILNAFPTFQAWYLERE